jgi:pimeloyl-ACP methyl ester carboxylesterase
MRAFVMIAAAMSLAGCLQMTIDEGTAFAPPERRHAAPAVSATELATRWQAHFAEREASGRLTVEPVDEASMVMRFTVDQANPAPLDAVVRHGLLSTNAGSIAWASFSTLEPLEGRPLIVHCAGNAGDRYNSALPYARKAFPWGDVLTFDYPGYGESGGVPNAASFEAALSAVSGFAAAQSEGRPLVFWGHSLGGFVCARLASVTPGADGLILETTARNADQVADAWTPWYASALVRVDVAPSLAGYDSAADAARFGGPILVLGAGRDSVLPVRLARTLANDLTAMGANATYVEYPQAEHWSVPGQEDFEPIIDQFFVSIPQVQP